MNYEETYKGLYFVRDLAHSFPAIREKARMVASWAIADEVESLWTTYQQMMQFAARGIKDPQAAAMREDIVDKLAQLTVAIERQERLNTHKEQRYVSKRRELMKIPSMESIVNMLVKTSAEIRQVKGDDLMRETVKAYNLEQLESEHEQSLVRLFTWLWTSEPWTNGDANLVSNLLFSNNITSSDKAVIVSGITLALLEYPDRAKLLLLLDCYLSDDAQVAQRALVGFVVAMYMHYSLHYAKHFDELHTRLEAYKEDPEFIADIYMVMTLLMSSCTTDKVASKMRQDIMPALMQAHLRNKRQKKDAADMDELNKHGENPEWMDDERVSKKMREMADLQLSGADVYYSSFVHMKGSAFFGEMAHWFYPFAIDNPCVPDIKKLMDGKIGSIVRLMMKSSPFCDSDKYSMCFMFSNIGTMGEAMLEEQIQGQLPDGETMDDLLKEAEERSRTKRSICRNYIFDLYRFFYSYPYHPQFTNPFERLKKKPITPYNNEAFGNLTANSQDETAQYADLLMRKEFYDTARMLFESLLGDNEFDPSLAAQWQKLGFCYQHLGEETIDEALHAYEVANTLKPNSRWTLTHLIAVSEEMSLPENVIKHCQNFLELEPDNVKYLLKCANAMAMLQGDYASALPLLHKANYIDEQSEAVKLLLALCLTMTGEHEKAMRHVLDLMPSEKHAEEAKVLFAVVMLIEGNTQEAVSTLATISDEARHSAFFRHCFQAIENKGIIDAPTLQLLVDAATLQS